MITYTASCRWSPPRPLWAGQCRTAWYGGLWSQNPAQTGLPLTHSKAGYLSLNSLEYKNETKNQRNDPWDKLASQMVPPPREPPSLTRRWPCLAPGHCDCPPGCRRIASSLYPQGFTQKGAQRPPQPSWVQNKTNGKPVNEHTRV